MKEIVKDYPDWEPDRLDVMNTVIIGNLDQLVWLVCTFVNVKTFLVDYFYYNDLPDYKLNNHNYLIDQEII